MSKIATGIILLPVMPLLSQATSQRIDRPVTLSIVADTTFSATRMPIPFNLAYTISGDGTITSESIQSAVFSDVAKNDLNASFSALGVSNPTMPALSNYSSLFNSIAPYFSYAAIATLAVEAYQQFIVSDHTKVRLYQFLIPVDGYYDITYWVPGDADKPASDVYVTSFNSTGANTQTLFSQDAVSDRTLTSHVFLSAGLNTVKIDIGSGTLLTHTAGNLVSINLNDSTVRTWTVQGFPVVSTQYMLGDIIATGTGQTKIISIPFNPSSNPLGISGGSGAFYSNPRAIFYMMPDQKNPQYFSGPVGGQNSVTYYSEPDANISGVFENNQGVFTTTRLPDYSFTVYVHCVQRPTL